MASQRIMPSEQKSTHKKKTHRTRSTLHSPVRTVAPSRSRFGGMTCKRPRPGNEINTGQDRGNGITKTKMYRAGGNWGGGSGDDGNVAEENPINSRGQSQRRELTDRQQQQRRENTYTQGNTNLIESLSPPSASFRPMVW